jgi:mRNA interferase RelE/StbE
VAQYSIQILPSAERDLAALDKPLRQRIAARIDALADNPRPSGVKKLQGSADTWRFRVGDYRVLYQIRDQQLLVLVIKIGHRREIYR